MQTETRAAIQVGWRLALAHHPLCVYFQADWVKLGRLRLCQGCLATWPLFALSVYGSVWAWRSGRAEAIALLTAGMMLGMPQASSYLHRGGRLDRAIVKGVGGIGLGMVVVGDLLLPIDLAWRLAGLAVLLVAVGAGLYLRTRSILQTCRACPWKMDWDNCPGFRATQPDELQTV